MQNPDLNWTFLLQNDTSGVGVGAVLSRGEVDDRPIAYFSRKLLPREKAYSTIEKECLSIVHTLYKIPYSCVVWLPSKANYKFILLPMFT